MSESLCFETQKYHTVEKERKSENNWMMDWEINIVLSCLFKQLAALNKVFLISLLWWLTSFFTLKNHSWNSKVNWFLPTIINYSTCRKLHIFSTLYLQNSGLFLLPFSSVLHGSSECWGVRMMKYLLLAFSLYKATQIYHSKFLPQEKESR